MIKIFLLFLYCTVSFFGVVRSGNSANPEKSQSFINKTSRDFPQHFSILDVTNFTTWVGQDGFYSWNWDKVNWNGTYPKGDSIGVVFSQGFLWGGLVYDGGEKIVRVNGSDYSNGMRAGKVLYNSTDDPSSGVLGPDNLNLRANYQVWRVRRDWETIDRTASAAQLFAVEESQVTEEMIQQIHDLYEYDWINWPAALGAPFQDRDGNGVYDPTVDIPGVPGATQTLWFVANDLYPGSSESTYDSQAIGIEQQTTLWAYHISGNSPYNNMQFRRNRIIYTGLPGGSDTAHIDSMYFELWADPDLGSAGDDFGSIDTIRALMYSYNGTYYDEMYSALNLAPPAVGWNVLQGPINSAGDTLGLYSGFIKGSGYAISDPDLGEYKGTLQWYNFMRGVLPRPEYPESRPYINPVTGNTTRFVVSGDPLTSQGWVDGIWVPPGDRRCWMGVGPVTMAVGDTQDIILAQTVALGYNNLSSVYDLRKIVDASKSLYQHNFVLPETADTVTVQPELKIVSTNLIKENLTPDGILNNGEKAIYRVTLRNKGNTLNQVFLSPLSRRLKNSYNNYIDTFETGDTASIDLEMELPDNYADNTTLLGLVLEYNDWKSDTSYTSVPTHIHHWNVSLQETRHISGNAGGEFQYRIADMTAVKPDTYQVILESDSSFTFKDVSDGRTLLSHQPFPNRDGYETPMIDGIRLYSTDNQESLSWEATEPRWITGVNWGGSLFFGGASVGQTYPVLHLETVKIYFQGDTTSGPADGWASKGAVYRRDLSFGYDGTGYLPMAAYVIDVAGDERQVNITFVEDANEGNANHRWDLGGWNGTQYKDPATGGREYFVINNTEYDGGLIYNASNDGTFTDVLYEVWATQRGDHPYLEGDFTLSFIYEDRFDSSDVYLLTPRVTSPGTTELPTTFILAQNYSNPFNLVTRIDYALPEQSDVTITIYDLLGREVATLVNESQLPGIHFTEWSGFNKNQEQVASGVYFYRMIVKDGSKTLFTKTEKMILLR